jgi:predicted nucleic acid-binding protein
VKLYLDTSALVKLVQVEAESAALRRYLRRSAGDLRVTSALSRVELVRAVAAGGPDAKAHARRVLSRLHVLELGREVLDDAADLAPGVVLRSLDAIHLASARQVGGELRAILTYDLRMAGAATGLGLPVAAPS